MRRSSPSAISIDGGDPADPSSPRITLAGKIEAQAARTPDRIAVRAGERLLTFADLDRRANQLAHLLRRCGVGPEVLVGVHVERKPEALVALLAIHKAGGAHLPLDPHYPANRIAHMIEDSGVRSIVTTGGVPSLLAFDGQMIPADDPAIYATESEEAPELEARPENLAYLIYTSGSTGLPKGVLIEHRQLDNFFAGMDQVIERAAPGEEAWLAVTSLSFDISLLELFWTLSRGITVVLHAPFSLQNRLRAKEPGEAAIGEILRDLQITHFQCTPSFASMLLDDPLAREGLGKLRHWLVGGEPLPDGLAQRMRETGAARITNVYGPTETTVWSTSSAVEGCGISLGHPLLNQEAFILDDEKRMVDSGLAGELYIGGAGVGRGYHRRPELTAERFVDLEADGRLVRAYRTGDRVRRREDGALEFLGRVDHQVKIRGHRIELGEIEAFLGRCPGVSQAAVLLQESVAGPRLVAYLVGSAEADPLRPERLLEACRRELPGVMVPARVLVLDAFPQTPNGKIDRRRLSDQAMEPKAATGSDPNPKRAAFLPAEEIERVIAAAFESLLGLEGVSQDDDFFALGGHSLLAVRLFNHIELELGVQLPLELLLTSSTVLALGARVRERARELAAAAPLQEEGPPAIPASGGPRSLVAIRRGGRGHPFFCVHGAGGNVLNFRELSRSLASDRPMYGLQARGVDGDALPHDTIEEMARDYLEEVRALQPGGPYVIGGYSGGGVIAFEMARQLTAAGQSVAALVLLDTFIPGLDPRPTPLRERLAGVKSEGLAYLRRSFKEGLRRRVQDWLTDNQLEETLRAGRAVPIELRAAWLTQNFHRISRRYHVEPWSGRAVLYRAEATNPYFGYAGFELGWKEALPHLEVEVVPGDHDTLVHEPNVRALASRMDALLAGIA